MIKFRIRLPLKLVNCKAYIPLALESCVGLDPQHDDFVLPIPTCWYLEKKEARFGHIDFMLFVSISLELGTQRNPFFSVKWA